MKTFPPHSSNRLGRALEALVRAGVRPEDPPSRKRVYQLANITCLSAIAVTVGFLVAVLRLPSPVPALITLIPIAAYGISHLLMRRRRPTASRALLQFAAATMIFLSACYAGPQAWIQGMLFANAVCALLLFDSDEWEPAVAFALYPLLLFGIGEATDYRLPFVPRYEGPHVTSQLRVLSTVGPIVIVAGALTYFRNQLRAHQLQIDGYIARLKEEHQLQIHAHKMASLGEMAAGMAHEINTPLTTISLRTGRLRQALHQLELPEGTRAELASHVDRIVDTTHRVARIINSLRAFSHLHRGEPCEFTPIGDVVRDTLDLCAERITTAGVQLEVDVPDGLVVECRPSEIAQVLLNLLNNAFDACEGAASGDRRWIRVSARKEGSEVYVCVTNSGPLIPETVARRLFEPFFTTKRPGKGTGLGLSISSTLVRNHGGRLRWVSGEPHTTFRIELPQVQAASALRTSAGEDLGLAAAMRAMSGGDSDSSA